MSGIDVRPHELVAAVLAGDDRVELRPYDYATSATIDLLCPLGGSDGAAVVRKDLSPDSRLAAARATKPSFLADPGREIEVYLHVLPASLGAPVCFGAVEDAGAGRYWLFLERIDGLELWQIGDVAVWSDVARWLAGLHEARLHRALPPVVERRLVRYDADYYRRWPARARAFATTPTARRDLERVLCRHDELVDRLLAMPQTFVHGELYPSNVLVGRHADGTARVAVIDWETAAVGPPLVDLAALTEGWDDEHRRRLVDAYGSVDDAALDACRLHLCLRWLGWAEGWTPPPEHGRDWLALALRLADQLAL